MSEPEIELVKSKGFTVNIPSVVGAPVAIRTESNEIVVLVRLTLRPRDNVMDIALDISTSRDSAPVPSLNEDTPTDVSRYWRASIHDL